MNTASWSYPLAGTLLLAALGMLARQAASGRWSAPEVVTCLLSVGFGTTLVLVSSVDAGANLFVVALDETEVASLRSSRPDLIRSGRRCHVIFVGAGTNTPEPNAADDCDAALRTPWRSATLPSAVERAVTLVESRAWMAKLFDALRFVKPIIVLTRATDRAGAENLRLQSLIERLAAQGIRIEIADPESSGSTATAAAMTITPRQSEISGNYSDNLSFTIEVTGAGVAPTDVACSLGGDCVPDAPCVGARCSCPAGTECSPFGRCATRCSPSAGCAPRDAGTSMLCLDGFCSSESWRPNVLAAQAWGGPSQTLLLKDFEGVSLPDNRWHALRCAALDADKHAIAIATVMVPKKLRTAFAVRGESQRFRLEAFPRDPATGVIEPVVPYHEAWKNRAALSLDSRFRVEVSSEKDFKNELAVVSSTTDVVVISDASKKFWTENCKALGEARRDGKVLVVSGLPAATACPEQRLPELATTDVVFSREPRVVIIPDHSRQGAILWPPPTPAAGTLKLEAAATPATLSDGEWIQQRLMETALEGRQGTQSILDASGRPLERTVERYLLPEREEIPPQQPGSKSMLSSSSVAKRLAPQTEFFQKVPEEPAAHRAGIQDVVVVFAYDGQQPQSGSDSLATLLAWGATVIVVPLESFYRPAIDESGCDGTCFDLLTWLKTSVAVAGKKAPTGRLVGTATTARRLLSWNGADFVPVGGLQQIVPIALEEASVAPVGDRLKNKIDSLIKPDRFRMEALSLDRFIDPRVLKGNAAPTLVAGALANGGVPLRFQVLKPDPTRGWYALLQLKDTAGVFPPLVVGGAQAAAKREFLTPMIALTYDPLEGRPELPANTTWRSDPEKALAIFGKPDGWGARRWEDLVVSASGLMLSGRQGMVTAMRYESELLLVSVRQRPVRLGSPPQLRLVSNGAACSTESGAALRLREYAPELSLGVFEAPPQTVNELCGDSLGCEAMFCPGTCDPNEPCDALAVAGLPARRTISSGAQGLRASEALVAAARYSGGGVSSQEHSMRESIRLPVVLLIAASLIALWTSVVLVRLFGRARRVSLSADKTKTDAWGLGAAVREIGEHLGKASSLEREGEFALRRTLAVGDPLRSIVKTDLLMSAVEQFAEMLIPRVTDRFRTQAKYLRIAANVGTSVTLPAFLSTKLRGAGRVCEGLAHVAWTGQTHVTFDAITGPDSVVTNGSFTSSPSEGFVQMFFLGEVSTGAVVRPRLELDDGESLVYVSDFLNEDLPALQREFARIEEEGGRVAVIHVYWEGELDLLESTVGSGGASAFRAGLSSEDLRAEQTELVARLERDFSELTGGVLSISVTSPNEELISAIINSPCLEVLR